MGTDDVRDGTARSEVRAVLTRVLQAGAVTMVTTEVSGRMVRHWGPQRNKVVDRRSTQADSEIL